MIECIIDEGGNKVHLLDKLCHRPNGPAMEWWDGEWTWYLYDKSHRYYGEQRFWHSDDTDLKRWFIHGVLVK